MKERQDSGDEGWTLVIRPVSGWFDLHLRDLWRYRDLIGLFVLRDFNAIYKQTILGPIWFLVQPLVTTLTFTVVFSKIAKIPTDGIPPPLFYLSGVVAWNFFSGCLTKTSSTFTGNANLFGKVWFPRLTVPISVVASTLISFALQLMLLLAMLIWYLAGGGALMPGLQLLLLPLLILQMAALGLGFGIVVSSLTTKYRDLSYLVTFGVQLWMYATPVVYPTSGIPEKWRWLIAINPMAPVMEAFRALLFGVGTVSGTELAGSLVATGLVLVVGVVLFSRIEKSFMDTV